MADLDAKITYAQDKVDDARNAIRRAERAHRQGIALIVLGALADVTAGFGHFDWFWAAPLWLLMLMGICRVGGALSDLPKFRKKLAAAERRLRDITMGWDQ